MVTSLGFQSKTTQILGHKTTNIAAGKELLRDRGDKVATAHLSEEVDVLLVTGWRSS